ncbi:MAG: helix-turn-helix domain-containing protein [Betaproteobacteria bacterium]
MAAERSAVDVGRKLRDAREERGITLRQIASTTKISLAVLEALERNDISHLPGGIFSRAFVRSYASQVGLDPDEVVEEFVEQFPHGSVTAGHPTSDPVEDNEAIESERRMASTFLKLVALSIPIAGAVLYLASSGGPASREAAPPREPAPAAAPPPASENSPSAGATPPEETRPPGPARATGTSTAPLRVVIRISRPCWISATVDGQKSIARLFQAGDAQTFDVARELVLTAGDAAAVAMTVNGAEAKPLGGAGEVVTARLNLANYTTYLASQ